MPLHTEILTPEQYVVQRDDVDFVLAPASLGDIGVYPGHGPLVSSLRVGRVELRTGEQVDHYAVSGGFIEARPEGVKIVAHTAEHSDAIDGDRALEARQRAEERLDKQGPDVDAARAEAALARAMNRLEISGALD